MEANNHYLYDKIVETDGSTLSGASIRRRCASSKLQATTTVDLSTLVPLYDKETPKEEVKSKRIRGKTTRPILPSKLVISDTTVNDRSKTLSKDNPRVVYTEPVRTSSKSSMMSTGSMNSILECRHKKSYLDLFHAKIGYVQGKNGEPGDETARAVIGDCTTRSGFSDESCDFSDAKSCVSDSSSFYIKFVEDEKRQVELTDPECMSHSSLTTTDSLGLLKSISEFLATDEAAGDEKKTKRVRKIKKFNKLIMEVPALGRLGPDAEANKDKLQKLKRQQSYGQKVSNENRIKMLETEVVKNFKQELKKSSQLNKSTKSVLGV